MDVAVPAVVAVEVAVEAAAAGVVEEIDGNLLLLSAGVKNHDLSIGKSSQIIREAFISVLLTAMDSKLKQLILQHIQKPDDFKASSEIRALRATDCDFSDDLFDSFGPLARLQIYPMLLMWCGPDYLEKVLERRRKVEQDNQCKRAAEMMLSCMQRDRGNGTGPK